ncbi:ribonuclease H family protein [Actinomyces polynesiensis]|uniref:ribonuclease H family protein n=1 Tax=Actinomyces polynesiensis TaxID=1325934 RepID=UPI0005BD01DE|nr:ribonuclease H [Actinomyces polynesiensis]
MTITAAVDGSALGNPGPAGWAWVVSEDCWDSGGWDHGTNNLGELTAVLQLLRATAAAGLAGEPLHVLADSQYAINTVTKWRHGWKKRGWQKADKKPIKNLEVVKALDEAMQGRTVTFEWVRGHAGHPMNERADDLARAAAEAHQQGRVAPGGPGFRGSAPARTDEGATSESARTASRHDSGRQDGIRGTGTGAATGAPRSHTSGDGTPTRTPDDGTPTRTPDDGTPTHTSGDGTPTHTPGDHPLTHTSTDRTPTAGAGGSPHPGSGPAAGPSSPPVAGATDEQAAINAEKTFVRAWATGDAAALDLLSAPDARRVWPDGSTSHGMRGRAPSGLRVGRMHCTPLGDRAWLVVYRLAWEDGASVESSVWSTHTAEGSPGPVRLVWHQSTPRS